jgi:hypothetical protein
MKPTETELKEYQTLVRNKIWNARYYELHRKIRKWGNDRWRKDDVWGVDRQGEDVE